MMRNVLFVVLLTGVILGPVLAQVPDPTRPPVGQDSADGAAAPVNSGIQTVILRPGGKSAAVINGQYLRVGDKFGDKRVLKISESEVVLKGESGREVLKVTPAIEKVSVKKNAARKSPAKEAAHQ
jgi:MSHA biogenesis protein MshK